MKECEICSTKFDDSHDDYCGKCRRAFQEMGYEPSILIKHLVRALAIQAEQLRDHEKRIRDCESKHTLRFG